MSRTRSQRMTRVEGTGAGGAEKIVGLREEAES